MNKHTTTISRTSNSLLLIAGILILTFITILLGSIFFSTRLDELTTLVNSTGKIRGSIQRATKIYLYGSNVDIEIDRIDGLLSTIEPLMESQFSFFTPDDNQLFQDLYQKWQPYKQFLISGKVMDDEYYDLSEDLWISSNRFVDMVELRAHNNVESLYIISVIIFSAIILLIIGTLIFRFRFQKNIENKALFDNLTGLFNRNYIKDLFERKKRSAHKDSFLMAVILCDIDHFKRVNDDFGHDTGDVTLKAVARLLKENSRETDIISRYGGEEFLILTNYKKSDHLMKYGDRLRQSIEETKIIERPLTISIGIAKVDINDTLDNAVARADLALYKAKNGGRNQVVLYKYEIDTGE